MTPLEMSNGWRYVLLNHQGTQQYAYRFNLVLKYHWWIDALLINTNQKNSGHSRWSDCHLAAIISPKNKQTQTDGAHRWSRYIKNDLCYFILLNSHSHDRFTPSPYVSPQFLNSRKGHFYFLFIPPPLFAAQVTTQKKPREQINYHWHFSLVFSSSRFLSFLTSDFFSFHVSFCWFFWQ